VIVAVGLTDLVPDAVTVPIPWLMETVVAFVLDQVSVDAAPDVIDVGDALSVTVGSGGGALTVTVALAVADPAELVAVTVYVVVAVGLTDLVPDAVTVPMLWSIETVVAFVLDQVSVDAAPDVMEVGEALIATVGSVGGAAVVVKDET
jgi:hypothetical protein